MNAGRRGFSALRELRFRLAGLGGELPAILVTVGLVGAGVLALWYFQGPRTQPAVSEFATVVHFGVQPSKYNPRPLVIVRTKEGEERQLVVSTRNSLVHCRKGSRIRLVRRGSAIFVDKRGCGQVDGDVPAGQAADKGEGA